MQTIRKPCPNCGKLLIPPMGNPESPYLLVGDFPGYRETIEGLPFAFRNPHDVRDQIQAGDVLKAELLRVGITLNNVLVTNLWQHEKAMKEEVTTLKNGKEKIKKVEACPHDWHLNELAKLLIDRTHILLMGSHVTMALLEEKVQSLSGTRVTVPGVTTARVWVSPNPALAFTQPIGELRLAFERFAEDIRKRTKTK